MHWLKPQSSLNLNRMYPSGTGSSFPGVLAPPGLSKCGEWSLSFLAARSSPSKSLLKGEALCLLISLGVLVSGCFAGSNEGAGPAPPSKGFGTTPGAPGRGGR